ncbi:MAG: MFS transporter [Planctomycetes bacterium]|nr:MFS transporter [Planctomycetota bacterium]
MNPSAEHPPQTDPEYPHQAVTTRWEKHRGASLGIVRRGLEGLVLLVAIQYFDAGDTSKAWLAAAGSVGQLSSLLFVHLIARLGLPVARAMGLLLAGAAAGIGVAASVEDFRFYFAGLLFGVPLVSVCAPLVTALWRQNIPDLQRGYLFSNVSERGSLGGLVASIVLALWIGDELARYRPVFAVLAGCLGFAAYCCFRIPSKPLEKPTKHFASILAWLWKDKRFGYVCATWMIMGVANLAILPLRVEYVASAELGLHYDAWLVLCLVQIIPGIARFVSAHFWGRLFDSTNFIVLRILLNMFFGFNMLLFFHDQVWVQVLASICFGLGEGGGEIAWSLWVTKFAPPERTAEYMSVHVFLTGLRGIAAPLVVYALLQPLGLRTITLICFGMIAGSCVLLLPLLALGRRMQAEERANRARAENPVGGGGGV